MTVEALRRRRPETIADPLSVYGRELHGVAYLVLRDHAEAEDPSRRGSGRERGSGLSRRLC